MDNVVRIMGNYTEIPSDRAWELQNETAGTTDLEAAQKKNIKKNKLAKEKIKWQFYKNHCS